MLKPMPNLLLMLLLMPGMATTVIPTDTVDTTVDTVDTTATPPILMPTIMERGLLMPRLSLLLMLLLMPGTDTTVIPDTTDTVIMDMVVITAGLMLVITDTVVGGNFLPIFLPRSPTDLLEKKPLP